MKKPNEKQYIFGQYAGNFFATILFAPGFAYVVFAWFGPGAGDLATVQAYVFLFIFFVMTLFCWGSLTNARKDFLRGNWLMQSEIPAGAEARLVGNPWRQILPFTLAAGLVTAALAALAVPRLGEAPFHVLNVGFMAGIPVYAVSCILVGTILPRDQAAFAAALARTRLPAAPFRRYLFLEHLLPWVLIQGGINFAFGLQQFPFEAQKAGGGVPVLVFAQDAGLVFGLIVFLMWMSAQIQVRPDVRLGRVAEDHRQALSLPLMLLLLVPFYGLGALVWGILTVLGVSEVAPFPAACFKAAVVMAAVVPGCLLGVWWGRRRETALIRADAARQNGHREPAGEAA